jgi:DNA polymerase IV
MPDKTLQDKVAYFQEQELLDISDGDGKFSNGECVFVDFDIMPPPVPPTKLVRQSSSFLGPTPRERQKEFETLTIGQPTVPHTNSPVLTCSVTTLEPDVTITRSFPITKPRQRPSPSYDTPRANLKKIASMPDLMVQDDVPFYKRMGTVPRELKNGKNVKLAGNINLDPEDKQLLKNKIVYFFPNDDVSLARRRRLHKIIQLGAAWVKEWRDDVTHVMVDEGNYTYSQILRSINKAGFPVCIL